MPSPATTDPGPAFPCRPEVCKLLFLPQWSSMKNAEVDTHRVCAAWPVAAQVAIYECAGGLEQVQALGVPLLVHLHPGNVSPPPSVV